MKEILEIINKERGVEYQENVGLDEVYVGNEIIEALANNEGDGNDILDRGIFCGEFWDEVIVPMYGDQWYSREPNGCVEGGSKYTNPVIVLSEGGGIDVGEPYWVKVFIYTYKGKLRATKHMCCSHGWEYLTKVI